MRAGSDLAWVLNMRTAVLSFFTGLVVIVFTQTPHFEPAHSIRLPQIASVYELGMVGKPASVKVRDGGATAIVGGKLLWLFGDTLFTPPSVDGATLRSSTAALADPRRPLVVSEPLDANGAPYPLLRFTPDEQHYNDSTGKPDDRIALWPGSVISDEQGGGIIFYQKLRVQPGYLNYEAIGAGIAHVMANQTSTERNPELLFKNPEPAFVTAMIADKTVYVYGNASSPALDVVLARVPLSQVEERDAYQFWDSAEWVADVRAAKPVMHGVPGGLSVSYNAFLQAYLAVHSAVLSNKVVFQVAPNPEGPWSTPVEAFTGAAAAKDLVNYAGIEHPELSSNGGQRVIISYFNPQGPFTGELRVVAVQMR